MSSPQLTVLQTELLVCFDVFHYFSWSCKINSMVHVTKLGLERYHEAYPIPNTQYYWPPAIPIPNTDTEYNVIRWDIPILGMLTGPEFTTRTRVVKYPK